MNKKFLNIILVALFAIGMLASCSDDKNETSGISGEWSGENLAITYGDALLTNKAVKIADNKILLVNVIPGEPNITIDATTNDGTSFAGVSTNANRTVNVSGTIADNKLTAKVSVKASNSLTGTWNLSDANKGENSAIYCAIKTSTPTVIFGMSSTPSDNIVPPESVSLFISMIGGAMLPQVLKTVTFEEDGNITAEYAEALGSTTIIKSPKGMAFYNVIDNKAYISLNLGAIMAAKSDEDILTGLMLMAEQGIPLNIMSEGGFTTLYLGKDSLTKVTPLFPLVSTVLPDDFKMYSAIIDQLGTIINESTSFDLGITLKK
ncbi:MAG: DUF4925 domain-containing protein [Muribaculaceae bacterium]|nr:DUF4925 domain-containing protein [Muribaculaceae bacterium]